MFIRHRTNSIIHMKTALCREDLSKADKLLLIRIMLETYEEFKFSIKDYSKSIKISTSSIKISLNHLEELGILRRPSKRGGRYRYIIDCSNF